MKLHGQSFENSPDCRGVAYAVPQVHHDIAPIEITDRYPAQGWAVNREVHETVYVARGIGRLALQSGVVTELSVGDVVTVEPNTAFAWDGDMTIVMVCEPAFHPDQYEIIQETDEV